MLRAPDLGGAGFELPAAFLAAGSIAPCLFGVLGGLALGAGAWRILGKRLPKPFWRARP